MAAATPPFPSFTDSRQDFRLQAGAGLLLNNPTSRKAPGILVCLEEARSVGLLSAPEIFGDLGIEWHPGRAAVEQRGLSLRTKTFPGSAQAANLPSSATFTSRVSPQTPRRDQRESSRELDTLVWAWHWLWVVLPLGCETCDPRG